MKPRALTVPLMALIAALSWSSPSGAQKRPVDLTPLGEKEAWAAVERAAPGDVFLVRGRRVEARDLKRRMVQARAAAEERRRKLQAIAEPSPKHDLLEQMRRLLDLQQRAAAQEQQAALESELREMRAATGPDTPEVRRLQTEAVRLAGQWLRATPEERRALEARIRTVQEQLRRLGAVF
jgi:hypothetical protein